MAMRHISIQAAEERTGWRIRSHPEAIVALLLARAGWISPDVAYQFKVGPYKVDFAWPRHRIALEVDGPMHFSPLNASLDRLRDYGLRELDWLVFRIDADAKEPEDQVTAQLERVVSLVGLLR